MSMITTEHRLRCNAEESCWVTLTKGERWFVAVIELRSGKLINALSGESFESEDEALSAARAFVCRHTGLTYE